MYMYVYVYVHIHMIHIPLGELLPSGLGGGFDEPLHGERFLQHRKAAVDRRAGGHIHTLNQT